MVHLLFVTGTPGDVRRGSGTAVGITVLRDALSAAGHRVTLLSPPDGRRRWSTASRLLFDFGARNEARRIRPDVAVGFDLDGVFLDPSTTPLVAALKGVRADELRFEPGLARLPLRLEAWLERAAVRRAQRVVTTSLYSAKRVEAYYRPRSSVLVVPEPIDITRWDSALDAAERPTSGEPRILCVAHLYARKDIETLLHAFAGLRTAACLRIVGTGPRLPSLVRLARRLGLESRVAFTGHLPFAALAAEYRAADVFCLPSRQEGFGIVFLEAMAARLPIVAARAGAVPEVVPDGECGLLAPPGDIAVFASALERLLNDAHERRRLGEAGRALVMRYEAKRVAREFLAAVEGPAFGEATSP